MREKPEYNLHQKVWRVCIHGRDTIEAVEITAVRAYHSEHGDSYSYDVAGYDEDDDWEVREDVSENHLFLTEEEAWKSLLSRLRGELAYARNHVTLIQQRIEEVQKLTEKEPANDTQRVQ